MEFFFQLDKQRHMIVGAAITSLSYALLTYFFTATSLFSIVAGLSLCTLTAGLKEGYDRITRGNVEMADFLATGFGGIVGLIALISFSKFLTWILICIFT
jgi:hypothetical protein